MLCIVSPMKFITRLSVVAALIAIAGCATLFTSERNAHYNPAKSHHTPEGFRNNYGAELPDGSFLRWQWERLRDGTPAPPAGGWASVIPTVTPDVAFLKQNHTERTLTWIGHATMLVQTNGVNILTDPHFSERASPVQFAGPIRHVPLTVTVNDLPEIDVIFVSHSHYDHLDTGSIRALQQRFPNATYIVPLGLAAWFRELGISKIHELDWWDAVAFRGLNFTFVPAKHWSKRTPFDRDNSLWGGIVIEERSGAAPWRFIYTGDTAYSRDFADIAARFPGGFDWLAVPIGAYAPRWFMQTQHVNPEEAVQIMKDLGARQALGVHWGSFALTDEALDQPPKDLATALATHAVPAGRFHVFKGGEMRRM